MTEELDIPIRSAGSTTWKLEAKRRGLEPDECYFVSNEPRVRGRKAVDLAIDPPPDLAIEVEITSPSIDKLPIYATLGIAEVWRYDGRQLRIDRLQADGVYTRQAASSELPLLPPSEVERFLDQRDKIGETTWIRSFRAWVQSIAKQGGDAGQGSP